MYHSRPAGDLERTIFACHQVRPVGVNVKQDANQKSSKTQIKSQARRKPKAG